MRCLYLLALPVSSQVDWTIPDGLSLFLSLLHLLIPL